MSPGPICVIAAAVLAALYLWASGGRLIEAAQAEIGTDDDPADDLMAVADALQVDPDIALVRSLARRLNNPDQIEKQIAAFDFSLWSLEFDA